MRCIIAVVALVTSGVCSSATFGDEEVLQHFTGPSNSGFGKAVGNVGDIDGDGRPDVVVGAPTALDPAGVATGRAFVYAGGTGALLRSLSGVGAGDAFGAAVSGAGDVNGDGVVDVVVGAPGDANGSGMYVLAGYCRLYSGADGSLLHHFAPAAAYARFGFAVDGVGDVNADGHDDVIVGAPGEWVGGVKLGTVRVFSGADGAELQSLTGHVTLDFFGGAVAGAGDVDGDGSPDFVVGARQGVAFMPGYAQAFSGATGQLIRIFPAYGGSFGAAIGAAGDANADGVPDVIIGAPGSMGAVAVESGVNGALLHGHVGQTIFDSLGSSVDGAGDVNGDGFADAVASAPGEPFAGSFAGGVHVYAGPNGATLAVLSGVDYYGVHSDPGFGSSVCGAGDVDHDGLSDISIGNTKSSLYGADAWVIGFCAGTEAIVGPGCVGSGGFIPVLGLDGCAVAGATVIVKATNGLGGALGVLVVGPHAAAVPLSGGCTLWVDPIAAVIPFALGGSGPGGGSTALRMRFPAGVAALDATLQAFVADASLPRGYSATNGLEVSIH